MEGLPMSWDQFIALLPKIMGSPPAIGAYCLLVLAGVSLHYRKQKSADWRRLLDSADQNPAGAVAIAEVKGFEHGFGGKLPDDSPNVRLLKRFRNAVFHYQKNFLDQRLMDMVREGQNAEAWVGELDREFRRYFRAWFDARKESGQPIPEV
jgi:hypothetical protein